MWVLAVFGHYKPLQKKQKKRLFFYPKRNTIANKVGGNDVGFNGKKTS